jgi:hypothetical protein
MFAQDWHEQPPPTDLHDIVRQFFLPGPTADIGCGGGREVAWLRSNGFPRATFVPVGGASLVVHPRLNHPLVGHGGRWAARSRIGVMCLIYREKLPPC